MPKRVEADSAPTRFSFPPALVHSIKLFRQSQPILERLRCYLIPDPIGFESRGRNVFVELGLSLS
jgi:hypothetical protein